MSWIVKRDPFSELRNFQEDFSRIFGSALPKIFNGEEGLSGTWAPAVDIHEDENSIVLEADLPGLKPGDFSLSIENYRLTLSGARNFEKENKGDNWRRVERSFGSFSRAFSLPSTVNVDQVNAEFKNGVLRVTLPKREEVKARQIQVTVADAKESKAKAVEAK
jgi:HSP20 family protein